MKWIDMRKYDDFPKSLRKNKYKFIFCMLILSVLSFCVFYIGTNVQSILLAFQKFVRENPMDPGHYEWSLDNFRNIFKELSGNSDSSTQLLKALKNTLLIFFVGNGVTLPVSFFTSYYFWKKMEGYKFFRVVFYLPSIISSVVMVIIYKNIISPNGLFSWINIYLTGEAIQPFLAQDSTAMWFVIIYICWTDLAGHYLLFTAAMHRIPEEIIESAQLDGITPLKEFTSICVPLIWPTLYIIFLQKVAGILGADGPILLLTNGGYGTYTLGFWSYMQVIVGHSYEFPAAVGIMMTLVVAPIAILSKYLMSKVNKDVDY